jgi:tRNA pseudouridine55 synthase
MTSHDVVVDLRRATGERRIGHAGTLDPAATGLLLVLIGPATRLERYLSGQDKEYEARIAFGVATDTLDAEGTVVEERPVPAEVFDEVRAAGLLAATLGPSLQDPPVFSAIKTQGTVAHRAARAGRPPVLEPRPIVVHRAELVATDANAATWDVTFRVSKGTYVRALARDLGIAAGTVAHLAALRRTAVGAIHVDAALTLEVVTRAAGEGLLTGHLLDPVALLGMPVFDAAPGETRDGRPLTDVPPEFADGGPVAVVSEGALAGIYRYERGVLRAETVFSPGIGR